MEHCLIISLTICRTLNTEFIEVPCVVNQDYKNKTELKINLTTAVPS